MARTSLLLIACAWTAGSWGTIAVPPLPTPTTNNAVTAVTDGAGREYLLSFAGLGSGKSHADTHARTFIFRAGQEAWQEGPPVPGNVGRLAAVAVSLGARAYVFGGYSVASDGTERSTPWVHSFDPVSQRFEQRRPMPVPVDDAVAVTYQDRYVYLISGWHDHGNVNLVQRYDSETDRWHQATPIPGAAVFGHAGGIVDDTIVYCDGVTVAAHQQRPRDFRASNDCFAGRIDSEDPRRIDWRRIDPHPGRPRYRMAASGVPALGAVVFLGGSTNPYNYNGIGYDGEASSPAAEGFYFDPRSQRWHALSDTGTATMDHRALVRWQQQWWTVGGMLEQQRVTDRALAHPLPDATSPEANR